MPELADRIRKLSLLLVVAYALTAMVSAFTVHPSATAQLGPSESRVFARFVVLTAPFIVVAGLLGVPLWRYVQWVSVVSRDALVEQLDLSSLRLEKWLNAGRILNIVGVVVFSLGIVGSLIRFRPDAAYFTNLLSQLVLLAYVFVSIRICIAAPKRLAAVRTRSADLTAPVLERLLVLLFQLTSLNWVISLIQSLQLHQSWLRLVMSALIVFSSLAFLYVTRQFVAQVAADSPSASPLPER